MLGNTTHNTDGNGRASDEGEKMMWSVRARERENEEGEQQEQAHQEEEEEGKLTAQTHKSKFAANTRKSLIGAM
jgi:hypothetical protein